MKRADYGLPEDKFLFACFNQLYKMDSDVFSAWWVYFTLQLSTGYYFSAFVDAGVWTYKNMCA
jgi:hypothetical protein